MQLLLSALALCVTAIIGGLAVAELVVTPLHADKPVDWMSLASVFVGLALAAWLVLANLRQTDRTTPPKPAGGSHS